MKVKALAAVIIPVVAVGGYFAWQEGNLFQGGKDAALAEREVAKAENEPARAESVDFVSAVDQGIVTADLIGNGREMLSGVVINHGQIPLKVKIPAAQTFESGENLVIVVRPTEVYVRPGKAVDVAVQTAAVRSSNRIVRGAYQVSRRAVPRIELFLAYVQQHPELSPAAIQTAILALTDNLPLSAVAKFQMAGGALPSRFNTDMFRVDANDIIAALSALKDMGMPDFQIAMTIDPQLRIEAMIDPLSRPLAMRYYCIAPEAEWEFWKNELLNGEPSTRHYALYGIARFYPEVALEMLPRWVRETRTNPVYRLSAAQALADTQKPEALTILRQLVEELGPQTSLGIAAHAAAEHLDYRLAHLAETRTTVAFRASKEQTRF